jgi:hypothetical protein
MTAHTLIRRFSALAALLALTLAASAQAPATKSFNVPADLATNAIKAFSGQSGVEVLMPTDAVKGVRTHAVAGEMTPRAALEKMVAGTGLTVIQDEKTGALGLRADPARQKTPIAARLMPTRCYRRTPDRRHQAGDLHGARHPHPPDRERGPVARQQL